MKKIIYIQILITIFSFNSMAQLKIPAVYSNLSVNADNDLVLKIDSNEVIAKTIDAVYKLDDFEKAWQGGAKGLVFESGKKDMTGTIYYGLVPYGDSKYPLVVYRSSGPIRGGQAKVPIMDKLSKRYDMVGWEKSGKGVIGYRIFNTHGAIIYDGLIGFKYDGTFKVDLTVLEGPFINRLSPSGTVISFKTNQKALCTITVDGKDFKDASATINHEIEITGLHAAKEYGYVLKYGNNTQQYSFITAPKNGSRKPFVFGYASDCRRGNGGGERNIYGHNGYMVKKIMALSSANKVAFLQFTGDLIGGYALNEEDMDLQYANFKQTTSPFAHYFPLVVGMGNHEALIYTFTDPKLDLWTSIDKFPFATESSEAIFAKNFVNPLNGPDSEDGSMYDPDKNKIDFPSYKETAFYYTYGNVAMISLNADYFYAPTHDAAITSGNIHGYIMDNQLEWLKNTLKKFEKDDKIDHVFVTVHTPAFPNGGHVENDMWYRGDNNFRAYVAGKPVKKGIIERRDELLKVLINKSKKTVALLTGDEHNYAKLKLGPKTNIYPKGYTGSKIKIKRTFWQINDGAAGAPYYAQEKTPWSDWVSGFTTQNALVLFYVDGKSVKMKVLNPDTLELVDEAVLR